jgi:hypothetical protein
MYFCNGKFHEGTLTSFKLNYRINFTYKNYARNIQILRIDNTDELQRP